MTEQEQQIAIAAGHGLELQAWAARLSTGDEAVVLAGTSGGATNVAEARFHGAIVEALTPIRSLGVMPANRVMKVDGESCTLAEFVSANADDLDLVERAIVARSGERWVEGGGAAASFEIEVG